MPQRDYILRMIEQAGAVLRRILDLVLARAAQPGEVDRELRSAMGQVGFDLDFARLADPESLERMVAPDGALEPGRGWLVAECLYVDGLEAELSERPLDAAHSYEKALRLYKLLAPDAILPSGFPEAAERIAALEVRLQALGNGQNA